MLRLLVLLLVLANGLFFAWAQGWLAPWIPPRSDAREPERAAQQLKPELITVLTPKAASEAAATAASAAVPHESAEAPLLCLEAGPFTDAGVQAAEALLSQLGVPDGSFAHEVFAQNVSYGVVIGRLADRDALRVKAEELRKLGVRADELSAPPSLLPGLRLGNYSDRYGAETALNKLAQKGVRSARVVELPVGAMQHWLRAEKADGELQTRVKSLPADGRLGAGFKPCAPRNGRKL
ncbi:MAG: hypothetical protein QM750_18755 [Rubrivivax sp.]